MRFLIIIKDNIFKYKLLDKRDKFPFFIDRMLHLSTNIPSSIFQGSFYLELLRVDSCTLLFSNFTPKASELYNRIVCQGGNTKKLKSHAKHTFQKYPIVLLKYNVTFTILQNSFLTN